MQNVKCKMENRLVSILFLIFDFPILTFDY